MGVVNMSFLFIWHLLISSSQTLPVMPVDTCFYHYPFLSFIHVSMNHRISNDIIGILCGYAIRSGSHPEGSQKYSDLMANYLSILVWGRLPSEPGTSPITWSPRVYRILNSQFGRMRIFIATAHVVMDAIDATEQNSTTCAERCRPLGYLCICITLNETARWSTMQDTIAFVCVFGFIHIDSVSILRRNCIILSIDIWIVIIRWVQYGCHIFEACSIKVSPWNIVYRAISNII